MSRLRRSRGFTLVEMLVVISIIGVVSTLGISIFFRITDRWADTRDRFVLDQIADQMFDELRRDFADIVSPKLCGAPLTGVSSDIRTAVELANDTISFPMLAPDADGRRHPALVTYLVGERKKDKSGALVRQMISLDAPSATPASLELTQGVLRLRFEYLGADGVCKREWTAQELPLTVRASIVLTNPEVARGQVARKMEFPIALN